MLLVLIEPYAIPGVVSIVVDRAYSAVTIATAVANDTRSAISSAVTSIKTAIGSTVPKNCLLGVKYFCISFTDHVDYRALLLNLLNIILSSIITIEKLGNIDNLDQVLVAVTPKSIKGCLVIGAVFAALVILLGIYTLYSLVLRRLGFTSFPLIL